MGRLTAGLQKTKAIKKRSSARNCAFCFLALSDLRRNLLREAARFRPDQKM